MLFWTIGYDDTELAHVRSGQDQKVPSSKRRVNECYVRAKRWELKNAEGRRERKWSGLFAGGEEVVRVRPQYLLLELVRVQLSSSSP